MVHDFEFTQPETPHTGCQQVAASLLTSSRYSKSVEIRLVAT